MRSFLALTLMLISCLGACDVPVKSQVPTHIAEFKILTSDYPALLTALDSMAAPFGLKRVGAAPGLKELHGREVLFASYEPKDPKEWRGALSVTDVEAVGKISMRVYGDYFDDAAQRAQFVADVTSIVQRHGGTLSTAKSK